MQTTAAAPKASSLAVWDAVGAAPASLRLTGKNDWIPLAEPTKYIKGDVIVSNGRIAAVLRRKDAAVDVHALKADGATARIRLRLQSATGEPAASVERIALVENAKGGATLEASFKTAKGAALAAKFRIKKGDVSVQV